MSLTVLQDVQSISVQPIDRSSFQSFFRMLVITDQHGNESQIMLSSQSKAVLEQLNGERP